MPSSFFVPSQSVCLAAVYISAARDKETIVQNSRITDAENPLLSELNIQINWVLKMIIILLHTVG